jgi:hypothetical protein
MNIREKELHEYFYFPLSLNYTERLAISIDKVSIFEFSYHSFLFPIEAKEDILRIVNGDLLSKIKLKGIVFSRRFDEGGRIYITMNEIDFFLMLSNGSARTLKKTESLYSAKLKVIDLTDMIIRRLNNSLIK